ncbi:hypothetical protein LL033_24855 (plasmid) [Clostridium estertheticum]|uniref:hypothetical protein n=1 Tax=Clostridium estertheticum TaxID=238834 RepID=UPI001C0C901F|nr:hypothetical protein [Clostridium estertheticum]MBU3217837.1 hypothetical protein [Clostridium estertheticum]WAG58355.1 hypothetical protein LL033_24855 [Clostridium estertheticum]
MKDTIGTVLTIGGDCSITYPGEFKSYPFTDQAMKLIKSLNIKVFAFTNQPGISRGESMTYEFEKASFIKSELIESLM